MASAYLARLEADGAPAGTSGQVRRHGVRGKQVHDANVVATMRANGLKAARDVQRGRLRALEDEIGIEALGLVAPRRAVTSTSRTYWGTWSAGKEKRPGGPGR